MPLTTICGIIGALAISGFPLTSGFTTKTLISQAAIDESMAVVYFLLAAASAGVFLHAGIKFPWFVFFQKDSGLRPKDAPWNMAAAMVLFSALCILIGVFPELFYRFLPYPVEYEAYEPGKVLFYLQLLLFSGLAFFLLLPLMKRTLTISLDTDWIWRVLLFRMGRAVYETVSRVGGTLESVVRSGAGAVLTQVQRRQGGMLQMFSRAQPIATTALWIALLLTGYVLAYFF
jgi:multicomponent Na+:H+ antiporter subunit D